MSAGSALERDATVWHRLPRLLVAIAATAAAFAGLVLCTSAFAATAERNVYYSYDVMGRQLTANFDSASGGAHGEGITSTYDGFGDLTSSQISMWDAIAGKQLTKKLTSSYDVGGRRIQLVHPENSSTYTFSYCYDAVGRLSEVGKGSSCTTAPLDSFTYGINGLVASRSESSTGASNVAYQWDGIGRLTTQTDTFYAGTNNVGWTLAYNPASQIVTDARNNNAYAWTGAVSVNRNYGVNGLNQYTSAGSASFTYDANGNLLSDGTWTYTYDTENRLIKAVNGSTTVNLTYDPTGRLFQVDKGTNASTTEFVYDGDALALEYSVNALGNASVANRYVHGSNAAADDPLVSYSGAGVTSPTWLHADHEGSIVAVTNSTGGSPKINTYDEYGIPGSANTGRFQYTGQAYIPELGLYYYKARFYSATLGRFLQTDPIGYKDQINLYEYVGDDPVDHEDPSGLETAGPWDDYDTMRENAERLDPTTARAGLIGMAVVYTGGFALVAGGDLIASASAARFASQGASEVSEAAESAGLRQNTAGLVQRIVNIGENNAKRKDFLGAVRESAGKITGHDHITEMRNSISGLRGAAGRLTRTLSKAGESMARGERSAIQRAVNYASKLADRMEKFIQ